MTDYEKLKAATPEQLLCVAEQFYAPEDNPDSKTKRALIRLGFALARPGGWEYIAPAWLRDTVMEDENDAD